MKGRNGDRPDQALVRRALLRGAATLVGGTAVSTLRPPSATTAHAAVDVPDGADDGIRPGEQEEVARRYK